MWLVRFGETSMEGKGLGYTLCFFFFSFCDLDLVFLFLLTELIHGLVLLQ